MLDRGILGVAGNELLYSVGDVHRALELLLDVLAGDLCLSKNFPPRNVLRPVRRWATAACMYWTNG